MGRGVYQDLVALVVEPHRREADPIVRPDQTQSHCDRLIEQPFVLWIEITQARCLVAFADRKLALLQAVSDTTKIGYREAFRHRFLHRLRAYAARDQYGRSKQPTKQYPDIVDRAYLVSLGNASSSGVDLLKVVFGGAIFRRRQLRSGERRCGRPAPPLPECSY